MTGVVAHSRTQTEEMFATEPDAETAFDLTPDMMAPTLSTQAEVAVEGAIMTDDVDLTTGIIGLGAFAAVGGVVVSSGSDDNDSTENTSDTQTTNNDSAENTSDTQNTNSVNTNVINVVDEQENPVDASNLGSPGSSDDSDDVEDDDSTDGDDGIIADDSGNVFINLVVDASNDDILVKLHDLGGNNTINAANVFRIDGISWENFNTSGVDLTINDAISKTLSVRDLNLSGSDSYVVTFDGNANDTLQLASGITATGNTVSGRTEYTGTDLTLYIDPEITIA